MSRRFRPSLESLDGRIVPATFGTPWPSGNLTVSFAPDGTAVDGAASSVGQAFGSVPAAVWQGEVLRAFQTWAVNANLNVGLVADGGQPLGTPGAPQGDLRFGDVRVAVVPLAPGAVALGMPFDVNAGTRSGDVWFNGTQPFGVGGSAGYDVFSVALHEAGHVLGVGENEDPASAMFDQAVTHTGLSAGDVQAVRALYGARLPDAFDAKNPNDTIKTATQAQMGSGPASTTAANLVGDITTPGDADVYSFQASSRRDAVLAVSVNVTGYSLLVPRVEILDASGRVVASGVGVRPGAGDVALTAAGLTPGATYYVRVTGATADVFGLGGYKLQIRPDSNPTTEANDVSGGGGGTTLLNPDAGSNDTIGTASQLGSQYLSAAGSHTVYSLSASLGTSTDVDFYRVRAPQAANNAALVMTVSVWTTPPGGTDPVADVYDSHGNRVATTVLVHDGGGYTAQLSVPANTDYYVAVRHAHPGAGAVPGNYLLTADFGGSPVQLADFAAGTLTAASPVQVVPLHVNEAQVLHLVLDLTQNPAPAAGARVAVFDSAGNLVDTRFAPSGDAASLNVVLQPGDYRVLVAAGTTDGSPLGSLRFALRGLTLSDPVGPLAVGTTTQPAGSPTSPPPSSPPPADAPPVVVSSAVTPVAPTTSGWWVAPPTDWTPADWATLAVLLTP